MRPKVRRAGTWLFQILLVLAISLTTGSVRAAFLYKSYIVRQTNGQDILCDPYIVQKDDYVLKIFRQRGEISNADFPEFLKIFAAINPHIQDVNTILPGQHIFIPLKKLDPGSVPDQEFGVVTIPFVTNSDIDDILKDNSDVYEVKRGDTVSKLLSAHFGRYGSEEYNKGLSIFKAMNPEVEDVNLILVGQELWLPRKTLQNELWYESLFDAAGDLAQQSSPAAPVESSAEETEEKAAEGEKGASVSATQAGGETSSPLTDAAQILDARLYRRGTYYFPRAGQSDLQLDLAKFPILQTADGARVLITSLDETGKKISTEELVVLKNFWKDLVVARLPAGASLPQVLDELMGILPGGSISEKRVLNDGGIEVTLQPRWFMDQTRLGKSIAVTPIGDPGGKTPQSVVDYMKHLGIEMKEVILSNASGATVVDADSAISFGQVPELDASLDLRPFVRNFYGLVGATYQENATISFEYAGIQIQAETNALNKPDGLLVLVDFQELQGEAVETLEKAGFSVFRVPTEEAVSALIPKLLEAAGLTCEKDPTFQAAERSGEDNVTIAVPGFLVRKDEVPQVILATVPVHDDLIRFFMEKEIGVVSLINTTDG